jgi:hypothetical protein
VANSSIYMTRRQEALFARFRLDVNQQSLDVNRLTLAFKFLLVNNFSFNIPFSFDSKTLYLRYLRDIRLQI